jgi:hypothetical protein
LDVKLTCSLVKEILLFHTHSLEQSFSRTRISTY